MKRLFGIKTVIGLLGLCTLAGVVLPVDTQAAVEITGSWTSGLSHSEESGSNRVLVLTAHVEDDDTDTNLSSVSYGGQAMTKVIDRNFGTGYRSYVVAYVL
ncbi:MAG: hypothetical protein ACYSUP_09795, partial [Planctomycetota bacterium]